uniref:Uncharacterized protein n=1 Tax=Branchiostoma floridae TaxID=7739 RepID=C3Y994_BRAFL|eukprot:XP_002607140.1 hypothetical protein BRAFLDRAFT_118663 [Branchiostoma floridae]
MAAEIVFGACFSIIFALQIGKSKITLRLNEAGEAGDFTCCKGGHGHHHLISDVLVQKIDCCSFRCLHPGLQTAAILQLPDPGKVTIWVPA